jgi:hypothetical protein
MLLLELRACTMHDPPRVGTVLKQGVKKYIYGRWYPLHFFIFKIGVLSGAGLVYYCPRWVSRP